MNEKELLTGCNKPFPAFWDIHRTIQLFNRSFWKLTSIFVKGKMEFLLHKFVNIWSDDTATVCERLSHFSFSE